MIFTVIWHQGKEKNKMESDADRQVLVVTLLNLSCLPQHIVVDASSIITLLTLLFSVFANVWVKCQSVINHFQTQHYLASWQKYYCLGDNFP